MPIKPRGRDSREEISQQMELDPDMFLGCFVGGELAGLVVGSYDQRKGWINRLAVLPEQRRKGIAKVLVEKIEETLRKKGIGIIATLIENHSPGSMEFFLGAGYVKHDDIYYLTKRESDEV